MILLSWLLLAVAGLLSNVAWCGLEVQKENRRVVPWRRGETVVAFWASFILVGALLLRAAVLFDWSPT